MDILLQFVKNSVTAVFGIIMAAMFLRAFLSWIMGPESRLMDFIYAITEPLITPVRIICEKFGWFENLPIDMPFIITVFVIAFLETAVEMINL